MVTENEEHPSYQLWKLRGYLDRYRPNLQTVMVQMNGRLAEFAFTEGHTLGDEFKQLTTRADYAMGLAAMGIDPFQRGRVYAYVINRKPEFVDKWYGWGVPR